MTHYLEDDKKCEKSYRFVTVEVGGIVRRFEEHQYGRGQDRADAYVDAIVEHSGWKCEINWVNRNDAKVPKKNVKHDEPLNYVKKVR